MKRANFLLCAAFATACANLAPPAVTVEQLTAARRAAADSDAAGLAAALTQLDAMAKDCRAYAPYHALCGEMTWRLAVQTRDAGKKGNIAFLAGDLPNAEAWLLDATRRHPDLVATDLGQSETTKLGLLRVGDRYMRDFKKAEAFFRVAAEAAGSDLDLLNNAAVYARDRGNQLERAGKADEARELYARSYATYHRAVLLDPTNVRLRNDCALVAIYHLERDWDLARQLLEGAIADGERTLRSPPQEERVRQDLDEAVGDCLENLALWHLKRTRDASAAKAAAKQSLQHFPGERRQGAQRHLEAANQLLAR